jgi:hypothetical protein
MFESPVLAVTVPQDGAPPCPQEGADSSVEYTELDLDRAAAELWALEMTGVIAPACPHVCSQECERGCTDSCVTSAHVGDADPVGSAAGTAAGAAVGAGFGHADGVDHAQPAGTHPGVGQRERARLDQDRLDGGRGGDDVPAGTALITEQVAGLPGGALAGFLAGVPSLRGLDGWSVVEVLKGFEKVSRWAAAGRLAAIAEIAHRYPDPRANWSRDAAPPDGPAGPLPTAAEHVSGPVVDQACAQVALAVDVPRTTEAFGKSCRCQIDCSSRVSAA